MFDVELPQMLTDREIEELTRADLASWDDTPAAGLCSDLDRWPPGPLLAAALSSIEPSTLNGHETVTYLRACSRMLAHTQAVYYRALGEVATATHAELTERTDEFYEYAELEVRAALTLTRRAAEAELEVAYELRHRLPRLWDALAAGDIDLRRAKVILNTVGHLDQETARTVTDRTLTQASQLTTGQLHAWLRRLCIETDPEQASKRLQHGLDARRLFAQPEPDGTGNLMLLNIHPHLLTRICRRVNSIARTLKTSDETRTLDQIRADIASDLLLGTPTANTTTTGGVIIHATLETLARLSDTPGELEGYRPVLAEISRQVADDQRPSRWEAVVTDDHGNVVATGALRRRPTAQLRREILARYQTCVAPGCRMPARQCDIDHRDPIAEGGHTTLENNAPTCRHDHTTRHNTNWTYHRLPDGQHQWTSPLGHTYTTSGLPP